MTLKVIGAGVGRTGTHSLKIALEQLLGGSCHHMVEVFANAEEEVPLWTAAIYGEQVDWLALLGGYSALVDWPGASFWPELSTVFPDALVLLSVRDPEEWYRSATNTIFAGMRDGSREGDAWMASMLRLLEDRFSSDLGDRVAMIDAYERHNDKVRSTIPADRLLEWTPSEGWDPICNRLGVAVPDEQFPVTNTTAEFRARFLGQPAIDDVR
ncbi:MAG TPA: sulfotransferase [Acidimicrobiales bacterium]|nr:sulfotransferase [Acidimicrobiales bacterium]